MNQMSTAYVYLLHELKTLQRCLEENQPIEKELLIALSDDLRHLLACFKTK